MGAAPQFSADLVTYTEEILNGKLDFLCSDSYFEVIYEYPLDILPKVNNDDGYILLWNGWPTKVH